MESEAFVTTMDARPGPSRTWRIFVLGWATVLPISASMLAQHATRAQLAALLPGLVLLGALYLRLGLYDALSSEDYSALGPAAGSLRRRALALATMVALVLLLVRLLPEGGLWWLMQHAVVAAGLALPGPWAARTIAGLVALSFLSAFLVRGTPEPMLLIQGAFGAAAAAMRTLTLQNAQLRGARVQLARLAVAEERLRFSRDLHDLLGHSLSLIVLKSELAGRLLSADRTAAARELTDIEAAAREALREVRATVAGYRRPALRAELEAASELLASAGISAHIEDAASPLAPALDELLAWSVREGVTNVIRHSRAAHCTIRIARAESVVDAAISDDGVGPCGRGPAGSGLTGLTERATARRATVIFGPAPQGGFALRVSADEALLGGEGA